MKTPILLSLCLVLASQASAQPLNLSLSRMQGLLQTFVSQQYGKSFERLGDESDFDHGHLLFDKEGNPLAILYHTREDSAKTASTPRSWLQWVGTGRIEEAARYARREYPRSAYWDWFVGRRLPMLMSHHTVTDEMLDPQLVRLDSGRTRQWVFPRVNCNGAAARVSLPGDGVVCLALGAS